MKYLKWMFTPKIDRTFEVIWQSWGASRFNLLSNDSVDVAVAYTLQMVLRDPFGDVISSVHYRSVEKVVCFVQLAVSQ